MVPIKVNLYVTVDVSEEQRVAIAAIYDDAGAKKRIATRDELKKFIWTHGMQWESILSNQPTDFVAEEDDDLI